MGGEREREGGGGGHRLTTAALPHSSPALHCRYICSTESNITARTSTALTHSLTNLSTCPSLSLCLSLCVSGRRPPRTSKAPSTSARWTPWRCLPRATWTWCVVPPNLYPPSPLSSLSHSLPPSLCNSLSCWQVMKGGAARLQLKAADQAEAGNWEQHIYQRLDW